MPNWCFTTMTITGNSREIAKFLKAIERKNTAESERVSYDINQLVPLDPRATITATHTHTTASGETVTTTMGHFATMTSDGFDGYDDALEKWGTKWGACSVEVHNTTPEKGRITIAFESAWQPADALVKNVSAMYPNLIFATVSDEETLDFIVWCVFHNGNVIEHGSRDPSHFTPEMSRLCDLANQPDADDEAMDAWYEAMSEWNTHLVDLCDIDATTCVDEYKKHLSYVRRCEKEGRMPRTFISSV